MPTIFSHAVFASVVGKAFVKKSVSFWFWLLIALCAIIPDADVAGLAFGIKFGSLFGHRGFTHSIMFALLFGCIIAFFADRLLQTGISLIKLFVYFSLATFSHPLLDMLTNGGSGVALFAPFSNERYFFPWRPVEVSPIGMGFFSDRGLDVILSEIIWIWLPAITVLITTTIIRKLRKKNK
jgi:inner membrane protein